jgi:hypothetical protein
MAKLRRHWLADHPRGLTEIAELVQVRPSYVSAIFNHKFRPSRNKAVKFELITEALRKAGAPGF